MKKNKISINIISSFNHSNLVGLLKNNKNYNFEVNETDYNQVFQVLSNPKEKIWKKKSNISLVWVTPEDVFPEFKKLIFNEKIDNNILKEQVISFCSHLKSIKKNSDFILIPNLILMSGMLTSEVQAFSDFFKQSVIWHILQSTGRKSPILRMSVKEFLWGYSTFPKLDFRV